MPVHQVGLPADMDRFLALAERHGLVMVEDAACAIGASYKGRPIGSLGPLACFSFHPRKVITCGEGGMIAVDDPAVAERLRQAAPARDGPLGPRPPQRERRRRRALPRARLERAHDRPAGGDRACASSTRWTTILAERRRLAERYNAVLARIPRLEVPRDPAYATRTWQSYPVRLAPEAPIGAARS